MSVSTEPLILCGCCGDLTPASTIYVDADLQKPVCPECKGRLKWAHAHLRRRTPQGVSITGMHGPNEEPIPWDPKIAEAEWQKYLSSQQE